MLARRLPMGRRLSVAMLLWLSACSFHLDSIQDGLIDAQRNGVSFSQPVMVEVSTSSHIQGSAQGRLLAAMRGASFQTEHSVTYASEEPRYREAAVGRRTATLSIDEWANLLESIRQNADSTVSFRWTVQQTR